MPENNELTSVNQHYLDNVLKLSETKRVAAAEDIFDARGTKLLAKGASIAPDLQERLIRHKLRKPLEASLNVADGVTPTTVVDEARQLFEEVPALDFFMGSERSAVLETLARVQLDSVTSLLLTTARENGSGSFRHGVLVASLSVALGLHKGAERNEQMTLALAGLFHDIGEMYINPEYLRAKRKLKPEEWKHVVVHPQLGKKILTELTAYPQAVSRAVAEHHERFDGSGYPVQLQGPKISAAGHILSIAEMLSGIILRNDNVLTRSCLALKLVPGEHNHELVSVIVKLRRQYSGNLFTGAADTSNPEAVLRTQEVSEVMAHALDECARIAAEVQSSAAAADLLERTRLRVNGLSKALKATGVTECFAGIHMDTLNSEDREILLELDVVGREIEWRLRDIAREMTLRIADFSPATAAVFSELIRILDHEKG